MNPGGRSSGRRGYSGNSKTYGQVATSAVPFESASVASPRPQTTNVPVAAVMYLYDVPEPVQPPGSVGSAFMNGPPTWPCAFVCCVSSTVGRAPLCAAVVVVQFTVAVAPSTGRPPHCAE